MTAVIRRTRQEVGWGGNAGLSRAHGQSTEKLSKAKPSALANGRGQGGQAGGGQGPRKTWGTVQSTCCRLQPRLGPKPGTAEFEFGCSLDPRGP